MSITLDGYRIRSDTTTPDGTRTVVYAPVRIRVRVADAANATPVAGLADLVNGGTVDLTNRGLVVQPDPTFVALRFSVNGHDLNRVEANAPLAVWGDNHGRLNPHGLPPGPCDLIVTAYDSPADAGATGAAPRNPTAATAIRFTVTPTPAAHQPGPGHAAAPQIDGFGLRSDTTAPDGTRTVVYQPIRIRVRVADAATAAPVPGMLALANGATVDLTNRGLIVEPDPGFAALRFSVNGQDLGRVEANPPLAVWGDVSGRLNAPGLPPGQCDLAVTAFASPVDANAQQRPVARLAVRFVLAGASSSSSSGGQPPLNRIMAPAANRPKFGVNAMSGGAQALHDTHVEGFGTNINYENVAGVDLRNVRSLKAYRDDPSWAFGGQGVYVNNVPGPVTIAGYFAGWNGWQPDKPPTDRSMFRHAGYFNFNASTPTVTDWLAVGQPASGGLFRNGGKIDNFACLDCGIGLEASQGLLTVSNGVIFGGNYYADYKLDANLHVVGVKAWTGMCGVSADHPMQLKNVWIVARPNQALGDAAVQAHAQATGARRFPGGALRSNWKDQDPGHPEWHAPARGIDLITCDNVHVVGWPNGADGRPIIADGNGWAQEVNNVRVGIPPGVTWHPTPVDYDYMPIVNQVMAGTMSIRDAVNKLRADITARVTS